MMDVYKKLVTSEWAALTVSYSQTISCKKSKEYETEKQYNQIVAENMVGYIMLQFVMYLLCCMVIVSKYKLIIW